MRARGASIAERSGATCQDSPLPLRTQDTRTTSHLAARASPVAVSREVTFAIEADMCYGKWGKGPYTSGTADGGYKCAKSGRASCRDPIDWTSTTELSEQFWARHLQGDRSTKLQYCQCFVYAGVVDDND